MAEIKEQRSAFAAHEKGAVQDWLDHPCTQDLRTQIDEAIVRSENSLMEFASSIGPSIGNEHVASETRKAGAVVATFTAVRNLFSEAQRYANS